MPTFSIITPLHNKVDYISDTIQSVLSQTYSDWEMLIVENGSTDGSFLKAQEFQNSRLHFLESPKQGPGAARNYALNLAQGDWIQFLDADDLLEPNHLEQQLIAAKKNPEAEIIACSWQEFTDDNPTQKTLRQPTGLGQPIQVLRDFAIAFTPWAPHAAIIKRSILSPDCYWPEPLDQYLAEDIAFWFKLVNQCKVAYGHSQGVLYRMQTPQCRNQVSNPEKLLIGMHAVLEWNRQYLENNNSSYTPTQCENLMTAYSQIYLLARKQKSISVEQQALSLASQCLKEYFEVAQNPRLPMLIRRLLGLKLFFILTKNQLKHFYQLFYIH
ncbi:glycosyltransferase family 2 protein [Microcoleus sp. FACHB-53]|nr:glycosyltransferase family 2 protein [Microcoleus sp. FACHB-53]